MLKRFLSVMLAATVMSQGIARAEEPAQSTEVMTVRDHTALLAHIEGLTSGDRIEVATGKGIVAGELVDKGAGDIVIDQPPVAGGAERIAILRQEIQRFRYQPGIVPHATPIPWKTVAVLAAIVAVGVLLTSVLVSKSSRR